MLIELVLSQYISLLFYRDQAHTNALTWVGYQVSQSPLALWHIFLLYIYFIQMVLLRKKNLTNANKIE